MLSASITVIHADSEQVRGLDATTTTGLDLFGDDQSVVAMRLNGVVVDLSTSLSDADVVESVPSNSPDGLSILRHSTAHLAAQALQALIPDAKLGIGPPITDGFYYDFGLLEPLTPDMLKRIEKKMQQLAKEKQRFVRRVVSDEDAAAELASEPFKLELITLKSNASDTEDASVEVGAGDLTIYDNVRRNGEVAWKDLCRGPHVPHTGYLRAFALTRSSAAYWRGDQSNASLQRLYGTAWATKEDLVAYQQRIEQAAKRDHRKLGTELDLFSFPDEIGSGLAVFHPNGGTLRRVMEDYSRAKHLRNGYAFVNSPHITKGELFKVSGHLDWYSDGMFPPMHVDAEYNEDGSVRRQGQDYYLKPMNCPFHCLIFRARGRSYRELPLRLFEFGTVYRYEKSGVIQGLTRARGFTQDDAHIYATHDQMKAELASLLRFVLDLLADYGLDDFYLELSSKNPDKFVGSDEVWEQATETLRQVGVESGLDLVDDPGGAAFYGPKISVQAKDALGRTWQMSTIQLDFNLPELFGLEYTDSDGTRKRPIMIHRALFGSVERFIGVLTEHYGGAFPAWLSPIQVKAIPVAAEFDDYLQQVADELTQHEVRVVVDKSDDRFGKKIRNAQHEKVPFMLIAGGEDKAAGAVSFRYRDGTQKNGVPIADAVLEILTTIRNRT